MASIVLSGTEGINSSYNHLGLGKKGFLFSCANTFTRDKGVYSPRFGLETIGSTNADVKRIAFNPMTGQVLRANVTTNGLQTFDGASWNDLDTTRKYGSSASMRNFTFLLTNEGLRRINAGNTATEIAYIPEGLDVQLVVSGATGYLPNNTSIMYVVLWGVKNSQDEFFLGAQGGIATISNSTGSSTNVQVTTTIPANITTNYFFQVYRTQPSASATTDPVENFALVWEAFPTGGEIAAGTVTFLDNVPTANGGPALYTNQGQGTEAEGNYPCEAALGPNGEGCLEVFADCLWASNIQPRSTIDVTLLSVGGTQGLRTVTQAGTATLGSPTITGIADTSQIDAGMAIVDANFAVGTLVLSKTVNSVTLNSNAIANLTHSYIFGDVITVAGVSYFASTTESISTRAFAVSTSLSAGVAVRDTCSSFIRVFNRSTSTTAYYCRYLSGSNTLPGNMRFTARTDRTSSNTIQCATRGFAFTPNIAVATSIISKLQSNLLWPSRPLEPEGFALFSAVALPSNIDVLEFRALRAALIVVTTRGIYRITGSYGAFFYDLIDQSTYATASDTVPGVGMVVVNNRAYVLSSKGLVEITESAVRLVDNMPKQLINSLPNAALYRLSAHEGDSVVFVPTSFGTFAYNTVLQSWTTIPDTYSCGVYDIATGKMVVQLGSATKRARSAQYSADQYYDDTAAVTINSVSGNVIMLSAPVPASVHKGDLITQGLNTQVIEAISGSTVTVADGSVYINAAATIYIGFDMTLTYCAVSVDSSALVNVEGGRVLFDGAELLPTSISAFDNPGYKKYVSVQTNTDFNSSGTAAPTFVSSPSQPHAAPFWVDKDSKRAHMYTFIVVVHVCRNNVRVLGLDVQFTDPNKEVKRGRVNG